MLADPAKDGLRDTSVEVNVINVSYETKSLKLFKDSVVSTLKKWGGAEFAVKGKISGTLKESDICCSAHNGNAISSNLVAGGEAEFEAKWNWLKGSRMVTAFTPLDELGVFTKLKVYAGIVGSSGELVWNDCEKKGSGTATIGGGVNFSIIDATVKGTAFVNGTETAVELTAVDFGGGGAISARIYPIQNLKDGPKEEGTWYWNAYFKFGEYKLGQLKFSLINLSVTEKGEIDGLGLLAM